MEPLTMALIASAVSAGLPYATQLVKEGYGLTPFGSITSGEEEQLRDATQREMKRMADLEKERDEFYKAQIGRAKAAGGRATGAALAAGPAGILGFNPILGAQARQGEMQAMNAIGQIRGDWMKEKHLTEMSRREAADKTAASIMAAAGSGTAARRRLAAMGRAYGSGPEADRLLQAAAMT